MSNDRPFYESRDEIDTLLHAYILGLNFAFGVNAELIRSNECRWLIEIKFKWHKEIVVCIDAIRGEFYEYTKAFNRGTLMNVRNVEKLTQILESLTEAIIKRYNSLNQLNGV